MKELLSHSPFKADADQGENGGVETDDEEETVQTAGQRPQQPAPVQHELHDLGHTQRHDHQVGHGQVQDQQVGHALPHFAVGEHDEDDQGVADDADQHDDEKEEREEDDGD